MSTVLKWIETPIDNGDPLEVSALAERAHMSARTLQRRFTSALGHGVKKEIYDRRMRHARELLRSGSIAGWGQAVGKFSLSRPQRNLGNHPMESPNIDLALRASFG
jgi:AraC-like DNA-binding protein